MIIKDTPVKFRSPYMTLPAFGLAVALAGWAGIVPCRADQTPPPREIPLIEKKQEQLSLQEVDDLGNKAFSIDPKKWKHAESENFVLHFRRATEARRVIREVEYTLWFVAKALGKTRADYTRKSHIFIFSGTGDWRTFLSETDAPNWSASFAYGDNLYLNIGGAVEAFDSQLLAHETTHAVVSRLYHHKRWPLWLNEGFAEYMGSASVAARRQQTLKGLQTDLSGDTMPLERLLALKEYPKNQEEIAMLYRTGERLVRFLMSRFPKERFPQFVDQMLEGASLEDAVMKVYGDQVTDFKVFKREYTAGGR